SGDRQHVVPLALRNERAADRAHRIDSLDKLTRLVPADNNMKTIRLGIDEIGPLAGSRLYNYDSAHRLAFVIGVLHTAIDEGAQKPAGAELQDGFGNIGGAPSPTSTTALMTPVSGRVYEGKTSINSSNFARCVIQGPVPISPSSMSLMMREKSAER